ncbi:MAG: tetratricopeptide repeat protein [Saprospiraceae bacterium]|nr:tetratricopeptide repeat protein [Saprospiraceae bacterium]
MKLQWISTLAVAGAFFCCTNAPKVDKVAELNKQLTELDQSMGGASVTDKSKAQTFIKTAEELASLLEKTDQNQYVDLLLKAAGLAKTIENPNKAIELYQKVSDGLPQHPKAPTALFMTGFVYENDLNNIDKAKAVYESFLQKYPNDPDFLDDAQNALKMLGKTPDEIIKEFEQQQPKQ